MRTTVKLALASTVTLATLGGAGPATAANEAGDSIFGGCVWQADSHAVVTGGQFVGVMAESSVTIDGSNAPTGATVECSVYVNDVKQASTDLVTAGYGIQAGARPISFTASDSDIVQLCEDVTYADGSKTPPCNPSECPEVCFPPAPVNDLLNRTGLLDRANDLLNQVNEAEIQYVDPAICPELVKLAGSYGPITIAADGDVTIADPFGIFGPFWDCPPYSNS